MRLRKEIVLTLLVSAVVLSCADRTYAYLEKTHGKASREAALLIQKFDEAGLYGEIYNSLFLSKIEKGSEDEDFGNIDGNNRSFRHYYDPDAATPTKGVAYHTYYKGWMYYEELKKMMPVGVGDWQTGEGTEVTEPSGGYYANTLEWGRNSAGAEDIINWEGALAVYDYTDYSREQAYEYVGHVTHLIEDMAQPDHASNMPHPGSGYSVSNHYGFEGLTEKYVNSLNLSGQLVERRDSFDDYFDEMARHSKVTVVDKFKLPLGLTNIPGTDVYLIPEIDDDNKAERRKYLNLAQELLTYSVQLNAGLLKDFYDIVNSPPYVKRVVITQNGKEKYDAAWQDVKSGKTIKGQKLSVVTERELRKKNNDPLEAGKPAAITVYFGPTVCGGTRITPESVEVYLGEEKVEGKLIEDRLWTGFITPKSPINKEKAKQTLYIYARDVFNHYRRPGLPSMAYELDATPASVAKLASFKPPYEWKRYSPGRDESHRLTIEYKPIPPIVKQLEVFSGKNYFKNERWKKTEGEYKAELVESSSIDKEGVDLSKTAIGTVRITFDRPVASDSVKVKFGPMRLSMAKIKDDIYEGIIYFYRLHESGLDEQFLFKIDAQSEEGFVIDGNPHTVAHKEDKEKDEWLEYEKKPDTTHQLRVFGEFDPNTVIVRGCVFDLPGFSSSGGMDLELNPFYGGGQFPEGAVPLSNFTVFTGLAYAEIGNNKLAREFEELIRARRALGRKIAAGAKKITMDEFKTYLKLLDLKDAVNSSLRIKGGSKPGWITTTDKNGEFIFIPEKYPGKDGGIGMVAAAAAFPPFEKPSHYRMGKVNWRYYCSGYEEYLSRLFMSGNTTKKNTKEKPSLIDSFHDSWYDILIDVNKDSAELTYENAGISLETTFSLLTKPDSTAIRAYLIKSTVDENIITDRENVEGTTNEVNASNDKDGSYFSIPWYPDNEPAPKFVLARPALKRRIIYCHQLHPELGGDNMHIDMGPVTTVFEAFPWDTVETAFKEKLWQVNLLPPTIEVDGIEIKDRKKFDAFVTEYNKAETEYGKLLQKYAPLSFGGAADKGDIFSTVSEKMLNLKFAYLNRDMPLMQFNFVNPAASIRSTHDLEQFLEMKKNNTQAARM